MARFRPSVLGALIAFLPVWVASAQSANLSIVKTGPASVTAGTDVTYNITVTNGGPDDALNETLLDTAPANTTAISFVQNTGPVIGGTFPAGATQTFTLVLHVNPNTAAGTVLVNTATINSPTADPDGTNNTSAVSSTVTTSADVSVVKTGPATVNAGANLTYGLTITNNGPSDAVNVNLTDPLPAGTTFVSALQNSGPVFTLTTPPVGGTGAVTCNTGTLAAGAAATFTVVVNVNAATFNGTLLANTANVSSATPDPNPGNDSATVVTLVINQADVSVVKAAPATVNAGANLTYVLTITNNGPSDAVNVILTDPLPAGTTFVSAMQNSGPVFTLTTPPVGGTGTVTCTTGTLAAGAAATFTVVVQVDSLTPGGTVISNTASVSSATADSSPTNNAATTTTTVNTLAADLSVTKTAAPQLVFAGSNVTYSVMLTSNGPDAASNVSLTDALPANTTFVSEAQNTGPAFTCTTPPVGSAGAVTCTISSLAPGASASFSIVVATAPTSAGVISNTAVASSATTDPVVSNNNATAGITALAGAAAIPTLGPEGLAAMAVLIAAIALFLFAKGGAQGR